jgi:hypothetical protein
MKKLLIALSAVSLLSGCALYDAYMMTGFDTNEYRIITEIRTDAGLYKRQCANRDLSQANATLIAEKTQLFQNYSEEIPRNKNGINASTKLHEIAHGLVERYQSPGPVSATFCKLKFESIESSAKTIQHVVGARPR